MKSNKQRYNDNFNNRGSNSNGGGGGGWGLAIILTIIIMFVIIALKEVGNGMAGKDDLSIGIGNAIPDAEEIGKRFR